MKSLRLAFMGTPAFSVPALQALHKAGHSIVAVYAQPPKPAGRGQQLQKTPVHLAAEALGLPVATPRTLRDEAEQDKLRKMDLDVIVVAAYGLILPQAVLDAPRLGCVNIHASLLPRWRGAAPIQRALLAGDTESGITIMHMEAGLDTGPMLLKESVPLTDTTTATSLHDALAACGARLILPALEGLASEALIPVPQPAEGVTYAAKLSRADGQIDWTKPAAEIARQIRALTPWPGTFFSVGGETIKILEAELVPGIKGPAGSLVDAQFTVACGTDGLRVKTLQRPSKKPTDGAAALRGWTLPLGTLLS